MLYEKKKKYNNFPPKESEAILKTAIECLPFDVFLINKNGYYIWQNSTSKKRWGNMLGKHLEDVVNNDAILEIYKNNYIRAFAGETVTGEVNFEINGINHYFYNIISPIYIDNKILYIIGINIDITKNREDKLKFQESKEKYRDIAELLPDIIYEGDLNLNLTYVNNVAFQKFGYTSEDLENGLKITDFIVPDYRDKAMEQINLLIQGKSTKPEQYIMHKKDGSTFYARIHSRPIFKENKVVGIRGTITDISDIMIAKQELKESEDKFRTIAEQSLMGICILEDFKIKYINQQMADIYGYSLEEAKTWKPREFLKVIHPDYKEMVIDQIIKKQQGLSDASTHYIAKIIRKDGKTRWVENFSKSIIFQGKHADLLTQIDITGKILAEKKVITSEEKYHHLYEKSPFAILLVNVNGEIIDSNLASELLTGFERKEFIGKNFADTTFIPKEYIYTVVEDFKTVLNKGILEPKEIQIYTKDKERVWVLYQASIFTIENEKIIQLMIENVSGRKKAEENLKESEAKYHKLFETSPDGVILTDLNGKILEVNSALENITGYSSKEFLGKNFMNLDIYYENAKELLLEVYKDLLNENLSEPIEFPIKTKNNKVNWVRVTSAMINMKEKTYILDVIHDITTLKEVEEAVRRNEEKFRDILETSSIGVMEFDVINKKLLYINPKLLNVIGFNKEELNEEIFRNHIIHPKDLVKLLKSNEERELEFQIKDKQGKLKWLAGKTIPHYNESAEIESIRVWLDDITEKKMYENLIYELNINFLNFTTDIRKNIELLLDACLKLLDGSLILYIHKIFSDEKEHYQIITSENETYEYSSEDFHQLFASILFEEGHDFPQTFNDIDKMKYTESDQFIKNHQFKGSFGKLIKSHEGLIGALCIFYINNPIISGIDKLVLFLICDALEIEQRRWQAQKDLEKQNKTLNKINKLKSELFSRTSHELKTPLISIKGFTELLLTLYKSKLDSEIISILEEIKDGSKRLEKIINLLLDSTKLETGQLFLNLKDENLTFLIKFCVKELQGLTKLRAQTISLNLQDNLETKFDKERIYEVISNLLVNAIKYTPPGGRIVIEAKKNEKSYVVSIKDNGIGFTEEEKKQVFRQFGKVERYGQGWDIATDGTGLGLYISKKLVELHGGKIWFESEGRNKGTTFYFSIPILK